MNFHDILFARKMANQGDITTEGLSVTENGTYTAPTGKAYTPVVVNVQGYAKKFISNTPTDIATFNASALPMPSLTVGIEATQDLHGYDSPWVGGAGKNKLQVTATTTTKDGVTFTVKEDGTIVITGTKSSSASTRIWFDIAFNISFSYDVILNGCPSGGSNTTYKLAGFLGSYGQGDYNDIGSGVVIPANTTLDTISVGIAQQGNINLVFKPMIRLATVSDATFAPYSNICPISGKSAVNVYDTGKNLFDASSVTIANITFNGSSGETTRSGFRYNLPAGTYSAKCFDETVQSYVYVSIQDSNGNYVDRKSLSTTEEGGWKDISFTLNKGDYIIVYEAGANIPLANTHMLCIQTDTVESYTAYNGQTYTTALKDANDQPLTCYGGQLANENGVQTLTVTHANIASYNGETINEPWISSMDVYSEGATPTTGAQVVYPLTTPTEIPQQSQAISTQDGINNIWADTGDVISGEYLEAL